MFDLPNVPPKFETPSLEQVWNVKDEFWDNDFWLYSRFSAAH